MIERTPVLNLATHAILVFGLVLILVPTGWHSSRRR